MADHHAGTNHARRRPLILHFDINKTIIMCDPVKGVDCDAMINGFLSEACWGSWAHTDSVPADADEKLRLSKSWVFERGPCIEVQDGLITYSDLLEVALKMEKRVVQSLKSNFTEDGGPGVRAREDYQDLQRRLFLPDGIRLPHVPESIGCKRYFIVPAFFNMLLDLEEQGRDARVVFRTFGSDTQDVIAELNAFCDGAHPCYPNVPATLGRFKVDLSRHSGTWHRDAERLSLTFAGSEQVVGAANIVEAIRSRLFDTPEIFSLALRDYFPHWRESGETDDSGKPMLVDPLTASSPHSIFFDDNIEHGRAHIVDARDAQTGEALPFNHTRGVYLIKSEPILAIKDPRYFTKAIAAAEERLRQLESARGS